MYADAEHISPPLPGLSHMLIHTSDHQTASSHVNDLRPELSLHCRYIPFSGGPRKCVGDQFALMEAVFALAVILQQYDFTMVPGHDPGMTTGATIHTANGMFMHVKQRQGSKHRVRELAGVSAA